MDHKEELYIPDYFNDDLKWLADFMEDEEDEDLESLDGYDLEDEFFESHQHSEEEAAKILGLPSEGINCDSENMCAICLDPLEKCYGDMKELPCKHIYHYNCILQSTKTKNSCPMCRGEYDYRETIPVHNEYPPFSFYTEIIRSSLTRMSHGFYMPEKREADTLFDEVAQVFECPVISFYPYYSLCSLTRIGVAVCMSKMKEARARFEMKEALALFHEAEQVLKSRWNPKNVVCAIWHMKPLPCKQIYDNKCIRGSSKMKSSCVMCHGNRSARRATTVFHANHVI